MPKPALLGVHCPKCGCTNQPKGRAVILMKRTRTKDGKGNPLYRRLRYLFCTQCEFTFKSPVESTTTNTA